MSNNSSNRIFTRIFIAGLRTIMTEAAKANGDAKEGVKAAILAELNSEELLPQSTIDDARGFLRGFAIEAHAGNRNRAHAFIDGILAEFKKGQERPAQPQPSRTPTFMKMRTGQGQPPVVSAPPSSRPAPASKPKSDRPKPRSLNEIVSGLHALFVQQFEELARGCSPGVAQATAIERTLETITSHPDLTSESGRNICRDAVKKFAIDPHTAETAESEKNGNEDGSAVDAEPATQRGKDIAANAPDAETAPLPAPLTLDEVIEAYHEGCDIPAVSRELVSKIVASGQADAEGLFSLIKGKMIESYETKGGNGRKTPAVQAVAWLKRTVADFGGSVDLRLVSNA